MNFELEDKVAIITGGASGIGESITKTFYQLGAIPIIIDKDEIRGRMLTDTLYKERAGEYLFIPTDLTDESSCRKAVDEIMQKYGCIDILINNAGVNDCIGLDALPSAFRESLERNLTHYFTMAHLVKEQLIANRGVIVNISSKVAIKGQGGTSAYAAAKGGILSLTREWARDLVEYGVRVNAVIPAHVWTPQYQKWSEKISLDEIKKMIPLDNRFTTAQEIANEVVFLSSQLTSHTTGQFRYVDGGYVHLDLVG